MSILVRYPVPRPSPRVVRSPLPGPIYHFVPQPTINSFTGWETGDLSEIWSWSGPPTVQSSVVRTGTYALQVDAGQRVRIQQFWNGNNRVSNNHVFGFAFRTDDTTPTTDSHLAWLATGGSAAMQLVLTTGGDLALNDDDSTPVGTATTPFTNDIWHYIEVYIEDSASGVCDVYIDGASAISVSGQDFSEAAGLWDEVQLRNSGTGSIFYFDDFYWMSGASSIADRLGGNASEQASGKIPEVFAYQKTDGGATDQGDTLDTGTWALASETPAVTGAGNRAEYTTTDAAGSMRTNSGTRSGPSGDANIDGDSNIIAAKYTYILTTDIASDHYIRYGNDTDGTQERVATVGTGDTVIEVVSEDPAVVPLSTESFEIGGRANGANDLRFEELWCHILHTPDIAGPPGPPTGTLPMMGMGV